MRFLCFFFLFSFLQANLAFSSVGKLSSDLGGVPRTDRLVSWNHVQYSMSSSTISARLWAESSSTAFRCLYHPFVTGLAFGNLPVRTFQHYIGNVTSNVTSTKICISSDFDSGCQVKIIFSSQASPRLTRRRRNLQLQDLIKKGMPHLPHWLQE
jgi:hypothetical protein